MLLVIQSFPSQSLRPLGTRRKTLIVFSWRTPRWHVQSEVLFEAFCVIVQKAWMTPLQFERVPYWTIKVATKHHRFTVFETLTLWFDGWDLRPHFHHLSSESTCLCVLVSEKFDTSTATFLKRCLFTRQELWKQRSICVGPLVDDIDDTQWHFLHFPLKTWCKRGLREVGDFLIRNCEQFERIRHMWGD